jgi:hypothetical protein
MARAKENKWFRLHHGIVPVKGKNRSAIYDFNRGKLSMISNDLYDLVGWLQRFGSAEDPGECPMSAKMLMEWLSKMLNYGWGHLTRMPHRFSEMPTEWHGYGDVYQAVVDHSLGGEVYSLRAVIGELDELMCQHLELRLPPHWDEGDTLHAAMSAMETADFHSVHLVLQYRPGVETGPVFEKYPLLTRITFYGAPMDGKAGRGARKVRYRTAGVDSLTGMPAMPYVVTRSFFSEARVFNPYYNRRVTVDRNGYIRNDLGLKRHFGNVNACAIGKIIATDGFRELWNANADRIIGLRDDPFRYAVLPMVELVPQGNKGLYRIVGKMSEFNFR